MPFALTPDGVELYYNDLGAGTPVVLIHGWPQNSDAWDKQAYFLANHGVRVITYDRRGFGKSEQTFDGYDYDTLAGDLNTIMEELDLQGATLVGFSMGGGEVVRYLTNYGATRVHSAVLVAAVTPYLLKTDNNPDGVDHKVFDDIEANLLKDRPGFLEAFGPMFYGRSALSHTVSAAVLEWSQSMAFTGSLRSTIACARSWSTTDFRAEMANITIPVLVIHGTADKTVPIGVSGRLSAKIIPNATLSEYDGEPHGLFITAADRLNEELLKFVGGTPEPLTPPKLT